MRVGLPLMLHSSCSEQCCAWCVQNTQTFVGRINKYAVCVCVRVHACVLIAYKMLGEATDYVKYNEFFF